MPIDKAAATTPRPAVYKGPQCSVGALLDTLDEADLHALTRIFNGEPNDLPTNRWISEFLVADGHPRIQPQTLNRHRADHGVDGCRR